jgi:uncharacterized membrane protein YdjX (TVP38/TMEM64 family)
MTGQHDSAAEAAPQGNSAEQSFRWRRLWPLAAIALLALVFFALDFDRFLDLEHLRQHRLRIEVFVADHFALAAIAFVILYVIVVVLSLPAASLLTMCAGFMFGWIAGVALAVCGATIGATLLYLAAKTSIGDYLRQRAGPWMRRAERGFADNRWSYMLMLRLVPAVPFFVANLVPAFLGVPLGCYVVTTFFGIMPGGIIYALIGSGLGEALASDAPLSVAGLLTMEMKLALLGLAVLAGLPILVKVIRRRRGISQ